MNFVVIGAGAWGTAFAVHLARNGQKVTLLPRRLEQTEALVANRENAAYLQGIKLPPTLRITGESAQVFEDVEVVLLACPSQALRETCGRLRDSLAGATRLRLVISLAKGLELGTHMRPSQIIAEVLPGLLVGSISGPTNAREVALGLPAAMVLAASEDRDCVAGVQAALSGATLRVYTSTDLAGVEYGGCLKNIYAIAAGCCDGLHLGDNTKAALLTRALTEMVRVGAALGADPATFYGLSGFGDLVATCHAGWSRNREFGQRIGEGAQAAQLIARSKTVVEGYKTTEAFAGLCAERRISAPILHEVHAILYEGKAPADALKALMARELKSESSPPLPRS